jgi:tetratricopeptide (TPR) repeat protein
MKSINLFSRIFIVLFIFSFCLRSYAQQNLPFLRISPQAKVVQFISFASIEINYSRPGMKGREIYGKLVPYGLSANPFGNGKPMPWRAGADENTTITLSHDAKINGKNLTAGTYGIHMIVHEEEWTIIFNKDNASWGSFFYEENRDALRITVKPTSTDRKEWLVYGFENISDNACDAYMAWGEKKVSFTIAFDLNAVVLETYRLSLGGLAGFNPAAWGAAARYCLQHNINLPEAMTWIDKALAMNGGDNFNNKIVKAGLLNLSGNSKEAEEMLAASLGTATEIELNTYGYQLIGQNQLDEAIKIFKMNIKNHPGSWNVYDSLGEALNLKEDKKGAKKNYEKAYELAPANQKPRIEEILKNL